MTDLAFAPPGAASAGVTSPHAGRLDAAPTPGWMEALGQPSRPTCKRCRQRPWAGGDEILCEACERADQAGELPDAYPGSHPAGHEIRSQTACERCGNAPQTGVGRWPEVCEACAGQFADWADELPLDSDE